MICLNFKVFLTFSYGFLGATAKCARLAVHHFQAIKVAEKIASFSVPAVQLAKAEIKTWLAMGGLKK